MGFGIEKEVFIFLQAILAGNFVYLCYAAIRVVRRVVKHSLFWLSVEDIFFWIGTGIYLFIKIYQTSNGNIRWYFVLGVVLGGVVTHCIVAKIVKKYIAKFHKKE